METDKYVLLGRYVESLSHLARSMAGRLINVAVPFLQSGVEISNKGKKEFIKTSPEFAYGTKLEYLNDFLYFAGVRIGRARMKKAQILEKKSVLSKRNQEQVAAFLLWLTNRKDYSEKTLYSHETGMKQYFSYADEFNQELARRYIATLECKKLSPKTINIRILTLRLFGDFIKKPIDIKKHKVARTLCVENVPTEKEYQLFLNWAKYNDYDLTYWVLWLLGTTGMRRSELSMIQWKHVVEGEAYLKCKGSKYRSIYFPKTIITEARAYIRAKNLNTDIYVVSRNGNPLSDRGLLGLLHSAAKKANFPQEKAHCHAFRHFFAKMYLKKTGDVIQLAELLGHESVDTTRIYLQKSKAEHVRDVNKNVTW